MSDHDNIIEDPNRLPGEPEPCMPCRGAGKVVSNQGGTPRVVDCPWCHGGGMRIPDIDAQAKWLAHSTDGLAPEAAQQSA